MGMILEVSHYPSYCSKWNPIEHRLFPHITRAISGIFLHKYKDVKNNILRTCTKTGLKVEAYISNKIYELKIKCNKDYETNNTVLFDYELPEWNYTVVPSWEISGSS